MRSLLFAAGRHVRSRCTSSGTTPCLLRFQLGHSPLLLDLLPRRVLPPIRRAPAPQPGLGLLQPLRQARLPRRLARLLARLPLRLALRGQLLLALRLQLSQLL